MHPSDYISPRRGTTKKKGKNIEREKERREGKKIKNKKLKNVASVFVCVYVCACARARICMYARVCVHSVPVKQ